ncbi:MAG: GNAT family N-acetyltransferase [Bdellovibrionota bacterium]
MKLRSLGYQTELLVNGFENKIEDRGDHVYVQTLDNPGFFWGNLLIFREPPRAEDVDRWPKMFAEAFAHEPKVKHCTFAWDSPAAERGAGQLFIELGFKFEESLVITAKKVHAPPKVNDDAVVRPLETDDEWQASYENQINSRPAHLAEGPFNVFKMKQMRRYRRMAEAGLGHWYGAFLGQTLVADLGIYVSSDGIARYQNVMTHPDHRRKGLAGTLVWKAGQHALDHGAKTLVMIADEGDHPVRIYKSCGFEPTEKMIGVYRWPKEDGVQ